MPFTYVRRAALALALLTAAGCTVKSTEPPPLTGPSGLALSLNVNAIPDSISQDGGSQSSVKVTAIGPNGKGIAALPVRLDMFVGGVAQDYGSLSARSIVTNSEGVATAVYTAPPSPVNGVFGTCTGLPGNCVSIVATATSTNFTTANPEQVRHQAGAHGRDPAAGGIADRGVHRVADAGQRGRRAALRCVHQQARQRRDRDHQLQLGFRRRHNVTLARRRRTPSAARAPSTWRSPSPTIAR